MKNDVLKLQTRFSRNQVFRNGVQDVSVSNQPITVKLGTYHQCNIYQGLTIEHFLIFNNFEKYKRRNFWHKFDTPETNSCYFHNFHKNENVGSSIPRENCSLLNVFLPFCRSQSCFAGIMHTDRQCEKKKLCKRMPSKS